MTAQSDLHVMRPRLVLSRADVWPAFVVAVAYYLGAEVAFAIGTLSDKIFAPFWPPNIVLFCALMLAPFERWWVFIAAAFPAHLIAELRIGMDMPQLTIAFVTNALVAAVNAFAVRTLLRGPPWLGDLHKTSLYIAITVMISPALCALAGAFVPILGGGSMAHYWTYWSQWYAANALASVTLGPIALVALHEDVKSLLRPPLQRHLEAVLVVVALVAVCTVVFQATAGRGPTALVVVLLYAPLPIIVWAAERFGAKGASGAILVVTIVLIWHTLEGPSLFVAGDPETNVFALQAFLIGLAVPILLLGASIDETRTAEQQTRTSEERMALAAASANIGLWHYSIPSGAFWASHHCRAMFGVADHVRVTPELLLDAIHPDERGAVEQAFNDAVYSGRQFDIEFRVMTASGDTRWMLASGCAHHDAAHQPLQVSGVFADISSRKSAEAEAVLQRREVAHLTRVSMLGELSGAIAHELHQPLTAILSNAQAVQNMLAQQPLNMAELNDAMTDIVQQGARAGEVIHRLRRLLRKDEGRIEPVDLGDLARSTLRLLHGEFVSRKVKVKLQLAEGLPPVEGDPVQLQQVLINLVMNAIEAMAATPAERRVLTVRSHQFERRIELAVDDRGPGVPADKQVSLFEPFVSTKEHGLGLGLSICSTIVKTHGGELLLVNNRDGGASALVRLPVRPCQVKEVQDGNGSREERIFGFHRR
jgi:PAS domain S-box-containing protein